MRIPPLLLYTSFGKPTEIFTLSERQHVSGLDHFIITHTPTPPNVDTSTPTPPNQPTVDHNRVGSEGRRRGQYTVLLTSEGGTKVVAHLAPFRLDRLSLTLALVVECDVPLPTVKEWLASVRAAILGRTTHHSHPDNGQHPWATARKVVAADGAASLLPPSTLATLQQRLHAPLPPPPHLRHLPTLAPLLPLFKSLYVSHIIHLLAYLLMESRIILLSGSSSRLSDAAFACLSLLRPLRWQHIFVSRLPDHFLDYAAAPMPFILGVDRDRQTALGRVGLSETVLVDLDQNSVTVRGTLSPNPPDLLPPIATARLTSRWDAIIRGARLRGTSPSDDELRAALNAFYDDTIRGTDDSPAAQPSETSSPAPTSSSSARRSQQHQQHATPPRPSTPSSSHGRNGTPAGAVTTTTPAARPRSLLDDAMTPLRRLIPTENSPFLNSLVESQLFQSYAEEGGRMSEAARGAWERQGGGGGGAGLGGTSVSSPTVLAAAARNAFRETWRQTTASWRNVVQAQSVSRGTAVQRHKAQPTVTMVPPVSQEEQEQPATAAAHTSSSASPSASEEEADEPSPSVQQQQQSSLLVDLHSDDEADGVAAPTSFDPFASLPSPTRPSPPGDPWASLDATEESSSSYSSSAPASSSSSSSSSSVPVDLFDLLEQQQDGPHIAKGAATAVAGQPSSDLLLTCRNSYCKQRPCCGTLVTLCMFLVLIVQLQHLVHGRPGGVAQLFHAALVGPDWLTHSYPHLTAGPHTLEWIHEGEQVGNDDRNNGHTGLHRHVKSTLFEGEEGAGCRAIPGALGKEPDGTFAVGKASNALAEGSDGRRTIVTVDEDVSGRRPKGAKERPVGKFSLCDADAPPWTSFTDDGEVGDTLMI
eukprot:CAMPEP_0170740226 /NCGR_PEP_ID=MMETSP0437-20130122/5572_1 /TAXON_ID=0 /ORGANISM="Sexangularia sp." /LENGTH=870 /DNA_ID=CAMNT_0011078715 /DNA_START=83 /DNA_END=2696 /DNA_ORIENTATION=-